MSAIESIEEAGVRYFNKFLWIQKVLKNKDFFVLLRLAMIQRPVSLQTGNQKPSIFPLFRADAAG